MTLATQRANLTSRARELAVWFLATLEIREQRDRTNIEAAKRSCLKCLLGEASPTNERDLLCLLLMFEDGQAQWTDDPGSTQKDFGLLGNPRWEVQELALALGLILAEKAAECFKSQSHTRHLFAASLLADAIEARDYWIVCRGIDRCRSPDARVVRANKAIQAAENRLWFSARQSERGRTGANAQHNRPGGNRDKRRKIQELWASGKYATRDVCAEQECGALGMSFSTARKALRNIPHPTSR